MMWGLGNEYKERLQGSRMEINWGKKLKQTLSCVCKHMSEGGHRSHGSVNMVSWYSQQLSHHFAM